MPYLNYSLPIQRTGFRPYGHTNSWAATQLSGMGARQVFSEPGGRRLIGMGQWQSGFSPALLHGLGLAGDPNCDAGMPYDVAGNPCLASAGYIVPDVIPAAPGSVPPLCGGPGGEFVSCADPSCKTGPCAGAGVAQLGPGAAPRVPVPASQFPQTSYQTAACAPGYVYNSASLSCMPVSAAGSSSLASVSSYLPWMVGAVVVLAIVAGGRR